MAEARLVKNIVTRGPLVLRIILDQYEGLDSGVHSSVPCTNIGPVEPNLAENPPFVYHTHCTI